jgi:hypothetical protein
VKQIMKQISRQLSKQVAFLILAFALMTAGAASATVSLGTLVGTVTDAQGKPLAGATVTMQTSDGRRPTATHTGPDGRFEFLRFRPGQYDLRAYSNGAFSDWSKRVIIRTGKTTEVTLLIDTHHASGPDH